MEQRSLWPDKRKKTEFSVRLSGFLRHRPEKLGLDMDIHGWVSVEQLLKGLRGTQEWSWVTRAMLQEVVDTDEKGRYRIRGERIKACQGHSLPWVQPELTPAQPPAVLYHGTNDEALVQIILSGGISRMERHAVHLQAEEEKAWKSARRWHGKHPVVICVDAARMAAEGHSFGVSENEVWCCEAVPAAYITRALHTSEKESLALATWNEKNRKKYLAELKQQREQGKEPVSRKLFYIDPVGTAAQNDMLAALTINYVCEHVDRTYLAETILSWEKPFFWVEGMSETEPGSGEFGPVRFDLAARMLEKGDAELLRRLYPHMDLKDHPRRAEIEALLAEG